MGARHKDQRGIAVTKEQKLEIDRLVSIYLTGITSVSNDAGWEGMSLLDRLITFKGQPPPPTGNDQSNMSMIMAVRLLREQHAEFPLIAAAMKMVQRQTWDQALAICAKNFYVGLSPANQKPFTDEMRAHAIGMDIAVFRYTLGKSYYTVAAELERAQIYRQVFSEAS